MAKGTVTTNTPTAFQDVTQDGVHVAANGVFDGASFAVEQELGDELVSNPQPILDEGVAIVITADIDFLLNVTKGDRIRLNPTGGGGSLDVDFNLAGASIAR